MTMLPSADTSASRPSPQHVDRVDGSAVRGLLTAFEWLAGDAPWPVRNVATTAEADDWLREMGILR
jgi:hypothetical protein